MARKPRWVKTDIVDGISEWQLFSWKYFHDFVYQEMLDFRDYVWRGHRCDNWRLEPTLDRAMSRYGPRKRRQLRQSHFENFKYAVRGRRGPNPSILANDNDWWALGQHHGLHTPLLDWTSSPFAAAYFAFCPEGPAQTRRRAIYALSSGDIDEKSEEIANANSGKGRPPIAEFVRPFADDNPRLVNQAGTFSRAPDDTPLETWIKTHFAGVSTSYILIKVTIPNKDREVALRSLNRMNINHLTLFPDLYGASRFCNLDLVIKNY